MTEPKKGWFQRLSDGLSRTSRQMTEQMTGALTKRPLDQAQLDELEEMLIEAGPRSPARRAGLPSLRPSASERLAGKSTMGDQGSVGRSGRGAS